MEARKLLFDDPEEGFFCTYLRLSRLPYHCLPHRTGSHSFAPKHMEIISNGTGIVRGNLTLWQKLRRAKTVNGCLLLSPLVCFVFYSGCLGSRDRIPPHWPEKTTTENSPAHSTLFRCSTDTTTFTKLSVLLYSQIYKVNSGDSAQHTVI